MSWIQKLYETYERCAGAPQFALNPLMPISHTVQQAHIEIVLDEKGSFLRAKCVPKEETIIPATEKGAGRVGTKPPPHPLCDKIQYCASDYPDHGGGKVSFYEDYVELLQRWCDSPNAHLKAKVVLTYVKKGTVVADLVRAGVLFCDAQNKLLTEWGGSVPIPGIFRFLPAKDGKRDQGDAFVRWRVQVKDDPATAVWEDTELRQAWVDFDASENPDRGFCMVTGDNALLAKSHPKRLRHGADGSKLISSNDTSGFTFRGRFHDAGEACGVGFKVTQKAHNALRWLIARQAYHDKASGQVFVTWAVGGQSIPDPLANTERIFSEMPQEWEPEPQYTGDAAQHFALRLKKLIAGYSTQLGRTDGIVVMGLDSASPGRMAITFYRELSAAEFLDRVVTWHRDFAWPQAYSNSKPEQSGKGRRRYVYRFIGAPAPTDIAEAAYGKQLKGISGEKLRNATVERLLPCIVDGRPIPRDLVQTCVRRVCNRFGSTKWEWEKSLGVACALYKGLHKEESYQMSLEEERPSRDYLFGRLLALAEHLEQRALYLAGEKRDSNAEKLMQRFADRPRSTWRNIELALAPYKTRLRARRPGKLRSLQEQLDAVTCKFLPGDFNDEKLSGEFLLGYHCQRAALWTRPGADDGEAVEDELIGEGE